MMVSWKKTKALKSTIEQLAFLVVGWLRSRILRRKHELRLHQRTKQLEEILSRHWEERGDVPLEGDLFRGVVCNDQVQETAGDP